VSRDRPNNCGGYTPCCVSVSHVSFTVVQTRGSEHFVSIWETAFLNEHPC
jgi:hypothetical protein